MQKNKKVLPCFNKKGFLCFCSRKSFQFEVASLAQKAQIIFKSENDYLKICEPLKHSGVDVSKCVFKLELYKNFDINDAILKLRAFKKLEEKGLEFNLFIIVDNYKFLQKFIKIVDVLNFKKSNTVRLYHCLEVDYKILCGINFLNLFESENSHLKEQKMGILKPLNLVKNFKESLKEINKNYVSIIENENVFNFENFEYKDYCFTSNFQTERSEFCLTNSFDFNNSCKIYKLNIKNKSIQFLPLIINFGTIFNKNIPKNGLCVCEKKGSYIYVSDKISGKKLCFFGKNLQISQNKNQDICVNKIINLKPKQELNFYFAEFYTKQELQKFSGQIEELFLNNYSNYASLDLPKINTQNKTLNYLINFYLPQKIIKNFILEPIKNAQDFLYLFEQKFKPSLINKKVVEGSLSKFFLMKSNLFSAYQNLLYFYVGAFCDKEGVNLNTDKSLISNNCSLDFTSSKKRKTLVFRNFNLNGEVKINNIKYSNLKFLKFSNMQDKIEVLY